MIRNRAFLFSLLLPMAASFAPPAPAQELNAYTVVIRDHQFDPQELSVPAEHRFKLIVRNEDMEPEIFQSRDLHQTQAIGPGARARLVIRPLKPGDYEFTGKLHPDSAKGVVHAE